VTTRDFFFQKLSWNISETLKNSTTHVHTPGGTAEY